MRWWPRAIRWHMLLGLVLLEALSISLFVTVLVRTQDQNLLARVKQRLIYESIALTMEL